MKTGTHLLKDDLFIKAFQNIGRNILVKVELLDTLSYSGGIILQWRVRGKAFQTFGHCVCATQHLYLLHYEWHAKL